MSPNTYVHNYFQGLANRHKEIKSFVYGEPQNVQQSSSLKFPCLVVEPFTFRVEQKRESGVFIKSISAFIVLLNCPSEKPSDVLKVYEDASEIALELIAKISEESEQLSHRIDLSSMSLDPVDPVYIQGVVGYRAEFELTKTFQVQTNPDKWNS